MISVEVVSESNLWHKKIKQESVFFNSLVRVFPKKYRFIKKKSRFFNFLTPKITLRNYFNTNHFLDLNMLLQSLKQGGVELHRNDQNPLQRFHLSVLVTF